MKLQNKKGFLLAEFTLKIVIAVLSIALLIYLLFTIYNLFRANDQIQQAESTLDLIIEKIALVKVDGENLQRTITNPQGWIIKYYEGGLPEVCSGESCLCICEKAVISDQIEVCNRPDEGVCKKVSGPIEIKNEDNQIEIQLMDLLIKKEGNKIILTK